MFTVDTINLSMRNPETGKVLTANIYHVENIDRDLSAAQLVMAICLQKAADLESEVVELMKTLSATTTKIENLSTLEQKLVALQDETGVSIYFNAKGGTYNGLGYTDEELANIGKSANDKWTTWASELGVTIPTLSGNDWASKSERETIITNVESKLDELNTISQKNMIELQSKTNKRDQAYDLITAMIKSISNMNNAIASNMQ